MSNSIILYIIIINKYKIVCKILQTHIYVHTYTYTYIIKLINHELTSLSIVSRATWTYWNYSKEL